MSAYCCCAPKSRKSQSNSSVKITTTTLKNAENRCSRFAKFRVHDRQKYAVTFNY
ncbi:MAG: hypothetical protein ACI89T_001739 [Cognaticolwellia sp.]